MKLTRWVTQAIGLLFILAGLAGILNAQSAATSELQKWRAEREAKLKADDGWLTVAGLFWLREGPNTVGTALENAVVLPPGSAPARAGVFELRAGRTIFQAAEGVTVTVNGQPVRELEVQSDAVKQPDVLKLNGVTLLLLKRGARYAVRLKDPAARTRSEFTGLRWYPGQPSYRVTAQFIPYKEPKAVSLVNLLGDVEQLYSPGYVTFKLNGQDLSLEPVSSGSNKLFFIFRDLTSGKTTYKPGRFLYADAPASLTEAGPVLLDFNQAINPPCAFTAYATCPLPPKRNYLSVAIAAGEQLYYGAADNHEVATRSVFSQK